MRKIAIPYMCTNTVTIHMIVTLSIDWIECHNTSKRIVDFSEIYLCNSQMNLRKWQFTGQTVIAPTGYLIVWVDSDDTDWTELHTNFRLSKNGEPLTLIDTDDLGNQVLDTIRCRV